MATTLEAILHYENLTGLVNAPIDGVPDILPPAFTKRGRKFSGNTCTYYKGSKTRKTAQLVQYGAPSVRQNLVGISKVPATMLHTFEHIMHDPNVLVQLMQTDNPQKQAMGRDEIVRQTDDFNLRLTNLQISAIYSALRLGHIYFDSSGNLLPSSSGAAVDVDFSVPSGNQNQLDVFGGGDLIGASWATASTNIIGDLVQIKTASRKLTGYPIKHAFYGSDIPGLFGANTSIAAYINGNNAAQSKFLAGSIPDLCEIQWHPLYEAYFEDSAGTLQDWWGADTIVFTPDPTPDWFEIFEGSIPTPTDLGKVGTDAQGVMPTESFGRFSYAHQTSDPCTIKHLAGDTFLPTIKVGGAIFQADVVF